MRISIVVVLLCLASAVSAQQPPTAPPSPTDRTRASRLTAADLAAALATLPADRPSASVRVFSLDPYNVNVERRLPRPQGASLHEAQAEFFFVVEGSATLLTGGKLLGETRNRLGQSHCRLISCPHQVAPNHPALSRCGWHPPIPCSSLVSGRHVCRAALDGSIRRLT